MLSYPTDPEKLKEVLEIEETLRFLFARRGIPTDNEIKTSVRLTQKYKALMNWNQQILTGPIYPTTQTKQSCHN